MLVLKSFLSEPHVCAYLSDRTAELEYNFAPVLTAEEYEELMNQGHRKFGPLFFRPNCTGCSECRPIRIPVADFEPDRSQRRAWTRNQDLEVRKGRPRVDAQRLELYHRYHQAQADRKGWPEKEKDPQDYELSFVRNPVPAVEVTLWEGEALRAVLLTDVTPNVVSGVYHYHDPGLKQRSLGTACMLHTIELARELGKRWAYFGYYVADCPSMSYKARFRPCEVMDEAGVWRPFDAP